MLMRAVEFARDKEQLLAMARAMHEASVERVLAFSDEMVSGLFDLASKDEDFYFNVIEVSGVLVGGMLCVKSEHYFSQDKYAVDMALWVDPRYRGTRAAFLLIDGYKKWAAGLKLVLIGDMSGIDAARSDRFFWGAGFVKIGSNFMLRV